jgi:hypothetical protein
LASLRDRRAITIPLARQVLSEAAVQSSASKDFGVR